MIELKDGAFILSKVTITESGKKTELKRNQIKIYHQGKYMFAFDNETTGNIDVAAGNARWINSVLVEEPLFNHDGELCNQTFEINIQPTEAGFNQVLQDMRYDDGRVLETMVEEWNRAPGNASEFDGLWTIKRNSEDQTKRNELYEIKMIGGGYYIVLQTGNLNNEKIRNFGFGKFDVLVDGRIRESGMVGSWPGYSDWSSEATVKKIDQNLMTQSVSFYDQRIAKTYVRL